MNGTFGDVAPWIGWSAVILAFVAFGAALGSSRPVRALAVTSGFAAIAAAVTAEGLEPGGLHRGLFWELRSFRR